MRNEEVAKVSWESSSYRMKKDTKSDLQSVSDAAPLTEINDKIQMSPLYQYDDGYQVDEQGMHVADAD